MIVDIVTQPELRPAKPRLLFEGPYHTAPPLSRSYDVAPDGERFVVTMPSEQETAATRSRVCLAARLSGRA